VVSAVVYWWVLPQLTASRGSLHLLVDVDSPWLGVATLAELASLVVFALATRALLARPTRPSAQHVLRIDLSTIALSHCLPGGGAAGTALGTRLLTRAGVPSADALFTKLAQGIGSAVVLQALLVGALIGRLLLPHPQGWEALLVGLEIGALLLLSTAAVIARVVRLRRRSTGMAAPRPGSAWVRAVVDRASDVVQHVARQVLALRAEPRRVVTAVVWATANWLFDAAALWGRAADLWPTATGRRRPRRVRHRQYRRVAADLAVGARHLRCAADPDADRVRRGPLRCGARRDHLAAALLLAAHPAGSCVVRITAPRVEAPRPAVQRVARLQLLAAEGSRWCDRQPARHRAARPVP
jgi:uncharacterized membrane protein YbhN (UPF0104 family)